MSHIASKKRHMFIDRNDWKPMHELKRIHTLKFHSTVLLLYIVYASECHSLKLNEERNFKTTWKCNIK